MAPRDETGKESLVRRWAHQPWHSWIKEQPAWVGVFAELWARLPESVLRKLFLTTRPLVVLPPPHMGRVVRLTRPLLLGAHLLQLDERLLERPVEEALGILAHELAHLCTPASDDALANDLAADRLAASWGFKAELIQALSRDLEAEHPRIVAARAA